MPGPVFSVIVPVRNGAALLPQSLGALRASDYPRDRWELIVVDDGSTDPSGAVAAGLADRVVTLPGGPHGPAYARNRGAALARGDWLVFIDADVTVHRDTLRRFAEAIAAEPDIVALFGAYDERPPAPGFLSRYRNLLHRYTHLAGAGEADTFWAGCGAVQRAAFQAVGGFDERRYPRPQIEDIELGYRLRDRGGRVLLRPEIQGAHLKRWTLLGSVRTDLFDRGIPWVRLLVERRHLARPANLNLKAGERVKTVLVALGLLLLLGGAAGGSRPVLAAGLLALLTVVLWNLPLIAWFGRQCGPLFALAVIPMNLWYYLVSGLAVIAGVTLSLGSRAAVSGSAAGGRPSP